MGHNQLPEKKKAQASAYQEELIELLCCYSGKPMGILEEEANTSPVSVYPS